MTVAASPAEKHNGGAAASADHAIQNLSSELADLDTEVRRFVRDRPLLALGIAVAAGYVVGRVFSKL